jgi:hypothetical protein
MAAPLDIPVGLREQRRIQVSEFHRMGDALRATAVPLPPIPVAAILP